MTAKILIAGIAAIAIILMIMLSSYDSVKNNKERAFLIGYSYQLQSGGMGCGSCSYKGKGFPTQDEVINNVIAANVKLDKIEKVVILSICELRPEDFNKFYSTPNKQ